MSENPLLDLVKEYGPPAGEDGPVRFVQDMLGVTLDLWQEQVLRAFGRGERRISIRACHGPGKTALAAWLVVYQMLMRFPQKTVATAPSRGQLEDALVSEVKTWIGRLSDPLRQLFNVKSTDIELIASPSESFFTARTARAENPEALQGVHSDHVLLIGDESSGVPEGIFAAAGGSMSGENATTLLLSNPVRSSGFFYDTHHKLKDMWFTVHVGFFPDEKTRPRGAYHSSRVTQDFATDMARRYGEKSNAYRIRVLGEFPKSDDDTIIPFELIEGATTRDIVVPAHMPEVWGLDVARFGDDDSVLVKRNKLEVKPDIQSWNGLNLMELCGKVKAEWDSVPIGYRPSDILVDVIGLGAGVVDRLQELGLPARGVNVSEASALKDKYRNLRTQLWFDTRDWLDKMNVKLPSCEGGCSNKCVHERLRTELSLLRYKFTSTGKIWAEPKEDLKKRGHSSPNVADAVVLTFASEPAAMIHGSSDGWGSSWSEPLHRDVAVV